MYELSIGSSSLVVRCFAITTSKLAAGSLVAHARRHLPTPTPLDQHVLAHLVRGRSTAAGYASDSWIIRNLVGDRASTASLRRLACSTSWEPGRRRVRSVSDPWAQRAYQAMDTVICQR